MAVVAALKVLMRLFSYVFHGLLALFLLAVSLLACSLICLLLFILAMRRVGRPLFFLWSLVVLVMMARGFFFSGYHFAGSPDFRRALYLIAGAILAACGAWFQLRPKPLR